jgi:DNA polymerase-3 subunit epsilon
VAVAGWLFQRHQPSESRWVVLDVESTGLDPSRDALLAIAAIALRREGERLEIDLADSFEAVLRHDAGAAGPAGGAGTAADKDNILVHGIGVGAMRAGADPATVLRRFNEWAQDAPRLGFHVGFDRALIERAEREHLGPGPDRVRSAAWLDIEPLAASLWPSVQARALDEWLAHFHVPCLQRHQAIADTLATAELLLHLWPKLRQQGGGRYEALAKLAQSRRWLTR